MGTGRIVVLHDQVPEAATPDRQDTLAQARAVTAALRRDGLACTRLEFHTDLPRLEQQLRALQPLGVFNLVESVSGHDTLAHLAPAWLAAIGLRYTGATATNMLLTGDKLAAKHRMRAAAIPVPDDLPHAGSLVESLAESRAVGAAGSTASGRWIVKSLDLDASIGLDAQAVVHAAEVPGRIAACRQRHGGQWMAERYIEGREINIALLQTGERVQVLPPSEILFQRFPRGRPRIVDYRAKWQPDSFEYRNTPRVFPQSKADGPLLERMSELALQCWELFGCRGYARVDFRVDAEGQPWVLEVNANPCLAPDAGFAATLAQAGLSMAGALRSIIEAAGIHPRPH